MENGNYNSAEFSWEYGAGNGGQSHEQIQMNQGGGRPSACGVYGYDNNNGGSRWLHSNQANTYNYQQGAMSQGHEAESSPFSDYNNAMMQEYTNFYKASDEKDIYGSMQGQSMDMGATEGGMIGGMDRRMRGSGQRSYGGYSNNGLDNPDQRQGQVQSHGLSSWF